MPNTSPSRKRWRGSAALTDCARALRRELTPADRRLWSRLRDNQLYGLHIRRQAALDRFIADFYHAPSRLVIEVDGDVHAEQVERDEARTEWFMCHGCRVIRFTNQDVLHRLEAVLEKIAEGCRKSW